MTDQPDPSQPRSGQPQPEQPGQPVPPGYGQQMPPGFGQQMPPGYGPPPPGYGQPPMGYMPLPRKKRHVIRNVFLGITGLFVLLIVISVAASLGGSKGNNSAAPPATTAGSSPAGSAATGSSDTTNSQPPAAPQYSTAQQQAIDAAEGYLSDGEGFSEKGLIQQLSSSAGNGFSRSLATFAVNHVQVNWLQQAVIAAKGYMSDGEGFSYSGLVQQLESPDGSYFTHAQAVYAAKKVGL